MLKIQLLISKNWLKFFFISTISLCLLVAFGDLVNNILRNKYTYVEIFELFMERFSFILTKIFPISSLIATLFTINKLQTHSELTAIFASGFSRRKFVHLIFSLSLISFLLQGLNLSFLDPQIVKMQRFKTSKETAISDGAKLLWFKGQDYFGSFEFFDSKKKTLNQITLYQISNSTLEQNLYAETAVHQSKGKWEFRDISRTNGLSERGVHPKNVIEKTSIIDLKKSPEDFDKFQDGIRTLNPVSLYKFIKKLTLSNFNVTQYLIIFYEKLILPFNCLLFALFPMFMLKNSSQRQASPGKSIVFALVFAASFWVMASALKSQGSSETIPTLLSILLPTILLMIPNIYNYLFLEKI
jgi:lipopolysaccharide export system permease protein